MHKLASGVNGVEKERQVSVWQILSKVGPMAWPVLAVFAVTLSVFPSIAVTIQSEHKGTKYGDDLFVPIYCFLVFNVADLIGRTLAGKVKWPAENNPSKMKFPVLMRWVCRPHLLREPFVWHCSPTYLPLASDLC